MRESVGQLVAILLIGLAEGQQQAGKSRQAAPIFGGEIGAAIKGLQIRGEKDAQGPAAMAGERLDRVHIGLIQVGALFPVQFDVDEVLVHDGGDGRIFKALVGHDVAPMAGGVADAQKDGLIFPAGPFQGLRPPGVPIHRIIGVLLQIGAGRIDETVGLPFWTWRTPCWSFDHASNFITDNANVMPEKISTPTPVARISSPDPKVLRMAGTEARLKDRRRGRLRHWPAPSCLDLITVRLAVSGRDRISPERLIP